MSRYKSGKLPKAFKIIPTLANWEEILYLTGTLLPPLAALVVQNPKLNAVLCLTLTLCLT